LWCKWTGVNRVLQNWGILGISERIVKGKKSDEIEE
jgi:hypothetical protein